MAENVERLSGRVGLDTTDFKGGLQSMNRELRVIDSAFKASVAGLGNWSQSADGLERRNKALTDSIEIQRQKVAALTTEFERVKSEEGENSRSAQDLEIKLNKANETLGKMELEVRANETALADMGGGAGDAGGKVDELGDKSEGSRGKLEGLKGVLHGVEGIARGVATAMLAIVASIVAVGLAITGLVFNSASAAAELVDLSTKSGISTTRLQELSYIGHQVGVDLDTITGANSRLIRSMSDAAEQQRKFDEQLASGKQEDEISMTMDQAAAFNQLGVSFVDSTGMLRDNKEVFDDVIDALGKIPNETERDALAMQIFGKSAQDLNGLIKAGSDEMARMTDEAHEVGAVMSEENVAALEAFDDTLASLKDGLKGTLGTLSTAFLPGFIGVFDTLSGYVKEFAGIVTGSGGDLSKIGPGLTGLITKIVGNIASQAPKFVQIGVTVIKSILDAIVSMLPQLLQAGVQIINTLLNAIITLLPTLIEAGIQILLTLIDTIIANLPMLIEAAIQAVIALAEGLTEALPVLIPAIVQGVITIVETLIENIPLLVDAALKLILGLANGLVAAIPVLIPAIPKLVQALVDALIQSLPMIGQAALQLVGAIVTGIVGALPSIGTAAGQIIGTLVEGVVDLAETLWGVGKDIVTGVWEGIQAQAGWFWDQITGFFSGIVDAVMETLGISSPSKEMFKLGAFTIQGFSMGAMKEFQSMQQQLQAAFRGLTVSPALSGIGGNVSTNAESFAFYAPVYFQGTPSPDDLGATIKGKQF